MDNFKFNKTNSYNFLQEKINNSSTSNYKRAQSSSDKQGEILSNNCIDSFNYNFNPQNINNPFSKYVSGRIDYYPKMNQEEDIVSSHKNSKLVKSDKNNYIISKKKSSVVNEIDKKKHSYLKKTSEKIFSILHKNDGLRKQYSNNLQIDDSIHRPSAKNNNHLRLSKFNDQRESNFAINSPLIKINRNSIFDPIKNPIHDIQGKELINNVFNLINGINNKEIKSPFELHNIEPISIKINNFLNNDELDSRYNIFNHNENNKVLLRPSNQGQKSLTLKENLKNKTIDPNLSPKKRTKKTKKNKSFEDDELNQNNPPSKFIINHKSDFRFYWDFIGFVIIVYTIIVTPLSICFNYDGVLLNLEISFEIFFIMDLLFNFITTYDDEEENTEKSLNRILTNYFSTWLIIDIISSIPSSIIIKLWYRFPYNIFEDSNFHVSINILKWINLLRITKLVKSQLTGRTYFSGKYSENISLQRVFQMIFFFIGMIHISSCLYIFIASCRINDVNWVDNFHYSFYERNTLYLASLYYNTVTIYTVGYGDIFPINPIEILYMSIFMFFGSQLYSYGISALSQIFLEKNEIYSIFKKKKDILKSIEQEFNLPKNLHSKLKNNLKKEFKKNQIERYEFLDSLPNKIKNDIILIIYKKSIKEQTIFINQPYDFILTVLPHLKPHQVFKNDPIFSQGEFLEEMYLVIKGLLSLNLTINEQKIEIGLIRENHHFGELLMHINKQSPYEMICKSKICNMLVLKKNDFFKIKNLFHENIQNILEDSFKKFEILDKRRHIILELMEFWKKPELIKKKVMKLNLYLMNKGFKDFYEKGVDTQEAYEFIINSSNMNNTNALLESIEKIDKIYKHDFKIKQSVFHEILDPEKSEKKLSIIHEEDQISSENDENQQSKMNLNDNSPNFLINNQNQKDSSEIPHSFQNKISIPGGKLDSIEKKAQESYQPDVPLNSIISLDDKNNSQIICNPISNKNSKKIETIQEIRSSSFTNLKKGFSDNEKNSPLLKNDSIFLSPSPIRKNQIKEESPMYIRKDKTTSFYVDSQTIESINCKTSPKKNQKLKKKISLVNKKQFISALEDISKNFDNSKIQDISRRENLLSRKTLNLLNKTKTMKEDLNEINDNNNTLNVRKKKKYPTIINLRNDLLDFNINERSYSLIKTENFEILSQSVKFNSPIKRNFVYITNSSFNRLKIESNDNFIIRRNAQKHNINEKIERKNKINYIQTSFNSRIENELIHSEKETEFILLKRLKKMYEMLINNKKN